MCVRGLKRPPCFQADSTLIKKKKKIPDIYGLPKIWRNAQIFSHTVYGEALSHIRLCTRSLPNFLIYEENLVFFPFSAVATTVPVKDDFELVS